MRSLLSRRRSRLLLGGALALALTIAPGVTPVAAAAAASPPIKVIQNYSEVLAEASSVVCSGGANTWYRRFDLAADHGSSSGFRLEGVVVGHQDVVPTAGTMEIRLEAYTIDPAASMLLENLDPLSATSIDLDATQAGDVTTSVLAGDVPAGKDLVIAVVDPGLEGLYSIGGNAQPQSTSAFILAPSCSLNEPTATDTLLTGGLMFYAVGTSQDCLSAEATVTAAEQVLAKATATYAQAKKKAKKANKSAKAAKKKATKAKKANKSAKKKVSQAQKALATAGALSAVECAQPSLPDLPAERDLPNRVQPGFSASNGA